MQKGVNLFSKWDYNEIIKTSADKHDITRVRNFMALARVLNYLEISTRFFGENGRAFFSKTVENLRLG